MDSISDLEILVVRWGVLFRKPPGKDGCDGSVLRLSCATLMRGTTLGARLRVSVWVSV